MPGTTVGCAGTSRHTTVASAQTRNKDTKRELMQPIQWAVPPSIGPGICQGLCISTNNLACNLLSLFVFGRSSDGIPRSGCSKHFIGPNTPCIVNMRPVTSIYTVGLPNGHTMSVTHTALLPTDSLLPPLSTLACHARIFPQPSPSLDCPNLQQWLQYNVHFQRCILLSKDGQTFTFGTRNHVNGL